MIPELKQLNFEPMSHEVLKGLRRDQLLEISSRKAMILQQRLEYNSSEEGYLIRDEFQIILGIYHMTSEDGWNSSIRQSVPVPAGYVYLFDDYTFEHARKKGVHTYSFYK